MHREDKRLPTPHPFCQPFSPCRPSPSAFSLYPGSEISSPSPSPLLVCLRSLEPCPGPTHVPPWSSPGVPSPSLSPPTGPAPLRQPRGPHARPVQASEGAAPPVGLWDLQDPRQAGAGAPLWGPRSADLCGSPAREGREPGVERMN